MIETPTQQPHSPSSGTCPTTSLESSSICSRTCGHGDEDSSADVCHEGPCSEMEGPALVGIRTSSFLEECEVVFLDVSQQDACPSLQRLENPLQTCFPTLTLPEYWVYLQRVEQQVL